MDRISNLPPSIIETILCLLPIQEAGRTSILSRDWRYRWTKIPKLAFFEDKFQVSTEPSVLEQMHHEPSEDRRRAKRHKLLFAIYQVLLMHQGPIHEFALKMSIDDSCVEIDHIILHLSRKNTVKILSLDLMEGYNLPGSFFSLNQLTTLYLSHCVLDLQPSFNGFGSLTDLHLKQMYTCETMLLRLLSVCPLLKRLTLDSECSTQVDSNIYTIVDMIKCLPPLIEHLSISWDIAWAFDSFEVPKELPTILVHLKYFCMSDAIFDVGLPFIILIIRSSPNLEKLKLQMGDENLSDLVSFPLEDHSDIMLEHLNELEIEGFSITGGFELDFLKFILAKSPVLEKVKILLNSKDEELQLSEILSNSPWASPLVKIIITNWANNDKLIITNLSNSGKLITTNWNISDKLIVTNRSNSGKLIITLKSS